MKEQTNNEKAQALRDLAKLFEGKALVIPSGKLFGIETGRYEADRFLQYIADMLEE